MTNRIMLCAHANENTIQLRTISARVKSPQRFYITYPANYDAEGRPIKGRS